MRTEKQIHKMFMEARKSLTSHSDGIRLCIGWGIVVAIFSIAHAIHDLTRTLDTRKHQS